jgi:transcriptional regulator with XRE-family HTH domain
MAENLEITQQYYSLIENGDRQKKMDIGLLSKLSDALNIPIADLIEMERRCTDGEDNDACGDGEGVSGLVPEVRRPAV